MSDFLDLLAADAKTTVKSGYYDGLADSKHAKASLRKTIMQSKVAQVITEVKGASPSKGVIRQDLDAAKIAQAMAKGGAAGISVLTEPKHFNGSFLNITAVRRSVTLPVLMKDIIVDPAQLEAASKVGADAVLLIQSIFDKGYCDFSLGEMVTKAHSKNLEVLLETHNSDEFVRALETNAELIGINNRNLGTLKVDLNTTRKILADCPRGGKVVVSESGISTAADLRFLRACGANAFLIGSSVMVADDIEAKVREFVNAYV